jgi:16S rRNA (adenine(1408)-N(1))-methyltransferase
LQVLVSPFERVVIDVGTGDGLFVYRSARANPHKFFIGIDANRRPLEKLSEKIYRKPAKGGLPNAVFAQAAVEDLPQELEGMASEIHVNFPWGSLLRTVAGGELDGLRNLQMICTREARLKVVLGIDPARDQSEIARLKLPSLSLEYIDSTLSLKYHTAGFEIIEREILDAAAGREMETSWARRLRANTSRVGVYLLARPINSLEWGGL